MRRFCFPLQAVASLRAHQEVRAREQFASAVQAYLRARDDLAGARTRTEAFEAVLRAGRREAFRAAEQVNSLAAYERERAVEIEAERAVAAAQSNMERRRAGYVEAHRKLEAIQRLEGKARTAHRREANCAEQAEFDDIAGRRSAVPALRQP